MVTKPINEGGVAIGDIINNYRALLDKSLWWFILESGTGIPITITGYGNGMHPNEWNSKQVNSGSFHSPCTLIIVS